METKIRLGLIGCGSMMKTHAVGVNSISDQLEITAVCDLVLERAEDMATVLNDPYVTTDYRTMLDYVDAVLIALPHDLHFECGVFFARHQKHVLMEKPLCNTEEECLKLINICEEEKVVLMCAYPVRFFPGIQKLKELVDSGEYGKVIQMSIWTEQLTQYRDETSWKTSARLGGGQFFSHGCHYVDILLWFLGNPVKGSHFGTRVGTPWLLKEGTSTAIMQFESGAIGYHGATWGARGSRMRVDYQIQTEKGMLEYHRLSDTIRLYDDHTEHIPGVTETNNTYKILWQGADSNKHTGKLPSKHTQFEILHFIDCIKNGKRPITDGRATLQGLRAIWAMYEAEKNNVVADLRGLGLDQVDYNEKFVY